MTTDNEKKITAYKGFDKNLSCRGFKYEIGGTFTHKGKVQACAGGFHSCEGPLDVLGYYPATEGNRFAVVELSGQVDRHDEDSKIASAEITIKAEIQFPELLKRGFVWLRENVIKRAAAEAMKSTEANTAGYGAHANTAGYGAHANTAGDGAHANTAGDGAHANTAGYGAHANTAGYGAHANTAGDGAHAFVKGKNSIASALGKDSQARAEAGGAIVLAAYDDNWNLVRVFAAMVGTKGIKAGKTYALGIDGKPFEIDEA